MKDKADRLRGMWVLWVLAGVMVVGAGCENQKKRMMARLEDIGDERLRGVVCGNLVATGGLSAWLSTERIEATALATVADGDGGESLVGQRHVLLPGESVGLVVTSVEPEGTFQEVLNQEGLVNVWQSGVAMQGVSADVLTGSAVKLRLMGQALAGASGLLGEQYSLRYLGQQQRASRLTHKIELEGQLVDRSFLELVPEKAEEIVDTLVVWLDAETLRFDRLWLRYGWADEPGAFGYLAANVGDYRELEGGLVVPGRIEVVQSDQYEQFSHDASLSVRYSDMKVIEMEK